MCGILAKSLAVVVGDDEIVLGRVIVHVAVAKVGVLRVGAATAVPAGNDEDRTVSVSLVLKVPKVQLAETMAEVAPTVVFRGM